ncbi:MAG: type II toxin-antitoxin system RelE/ParE family toxin [Deltaproteobacteria bacterium]|nr:type II toxin-antitoxin system RelE/ParE family toxin [Deltaproteobacteria bacterium]
MAVFLRSAEFDTWLRALKDNIGKARIVHRIRSAELGNFGDVAAVGDGVFEMRVHVGPGYRVYYARRDSEVWLLLVGGDKSTQPRDIARAKAMAAALAGSNS